MRLKIILPVVVAVTMVVTLVYTKDHDKDGEVWPNRDSEAHLQGLGDQAGAAARADRGTVLSGHSSSDLAAGGQDHVGPGTPAIVGPDLPDRQPDRRPTALNVDNEELLTSPSNGIFRAPAPTNKGSAAQESVAPISGATGMEYSPPTAGDVGIEFTAPSVSSGVDGVSIEGMADLEIGQAGPDGEESGLEYTIPEEGAPGMELILPDENESGLEYSLPNDGE